MKDDQPKVYVASSIDETVPSIAMSQNAPINLQPDKARIPVQPKQKLSLPQLIVKKITSFVMDFLETIVVALSIFVVVYLFIVQPHQVKGSSMEPNFHDNEYILTDKLSYRLREPKRGEVIIFKAPKNPDVDYIKRVIGLPGDTVKVEGGYVYVNDKKLDEPYLQDKSNLFPGSFITEGVDITISDGNLFVMGDNRPHSSDSREFGPIPKNSIIGRAFLRYWPPSVAGLLPTVHYEF